MSRGAALKEAFSAQRTMKALKLAADIAYAKKWYPAQSVREIAKTLHRDGATVAKWVGSAPQPRPEVGDMWRLKGPCGPTALVEALEKVGAGNRTIYVRLKWKSGKTDVVSPRDALGHGEGDGMSKTEHVFGNAGETGARACNRSRCTVRVAQAFSWWQKKKGAHWRPTHRELIPDCAGGPLPGLKVTP